MPDLHPGSDGSARAGYTNIRGSDVVMTVLREGKAHSALRSTRSEHWHLPLETLTTDAKGRITLASGNLALGSG